MLTTSDLLAAVKHAQGIPSNYRLARIIGVTDATVANWKHGRNLPDDPMCERLAQMAGLDPAYVIASIYAERAANDDSKRIWSGIAKRLQGLAAGLATVIVSVWISWLAPGDAQAAVRFGGAVNNEVHALYIVANWLRVVAAWLRQARRVLGTPARRAIFTPITTFG